jgi:hypothetical protein
MLAKHFSRVMFQSRAKRPWSPPPKTVVPPSCHPCQQNERPLLLLIFVWWLCRLCRMCITVHWTVIVVWIYPHICRLRHKCEMWAFFSICSYIAIGGLNALFAFEQQNYFFFADVLESKKPLNIENEVFCACIIYIGLDGLTKFHVLLYLLNLDWHFQQEKHFIWLIFKCHSLFSCEIEGACLLFFWFFVQKFGFLLCWKLELEHWSHRLFCLLNSSTRRFFLRSKFRGKHLRRFAPLGQSSF